MTKYCHWYIKNKLLYPKLYSLALDWVVGEHQSLQRSGGHVVS